MSVLTLAAPKAFAATYAVDVCSKTGPGTDISSFQDPGTAGLIVTKSCPDSTFGSVEVAPNSGSNPISGGAGWTLSAPDGATIKTLSASRVGVVTWDPGIVWELKAGSTMLESVSTGGFLTGPVSFPNVNAKSVVGHLFCTNSPCPHSAQSFLRLSEISVTVEDNNPPTAAVGVDSGSTIWGTTQIPYRAADEGGGVKSASVQLDGTPISTAADSNGGKCAEPFKTTAPCKTQIESSASLDTTTLAEGPHTLLASATDAAGQSNTSTAVTINVHNAPFELNPPLVSGKAQPGATLTTTNGDWGGLQSTFAFQWFRCPTTVKAGEETGCTMISGATQAQYVPSTADLGQQLIVKVTATNGLGSVTALSAPTAVISNPPQTKIARHPRKKTATHTAKFAFSSDQAGSSFQCKLDKGSFKSCRSPFKHKVKRGRHSFQVRAVNSAGVADPTPAKFSWKVS